MKLRSDGVFATVSAYYKLNMVESRSSRYSRYLCRRLNEATVVLATRGVRRWPVTGAIVDDLTCICRTATHTTSTFEAHQDGYCAV